MKQAAPILAAGSLWGIISVFVRQLHAAGFDSMQVVAVRVTLAALLLFFYLLVKDRSLLKIRIKDIPLFLGTGLLSITFFNFCYFEAIEVIGGAAVPALLLYTAPVFVMLLSLLLFREPITARKLAALLMTLAGLVLVTGAFSGKAEISPKAVLLGLGSGLGYALYSIFGKYLVNRYSSLTITVYTFLTAAVCTVPFCGVIPKSGLLCTMQGGVSALALAVLSTVLPYLLYTGGLRQCEAGKAAVYATIEPFVAAVVGVVLFHEHMTGWKIAGMLLILAAILLLNLQNKHRTKPA